MINEKELQKFIDTLEKLVIAIVRNELTPDIEDAVNFINAREEFVKVLREES